jgi:hypothetical protein
MIPENQDKALHPWRSSARYWHKYRDVITEIFAPLTSGLVEQAQIRMGQKVLDIGGGRSRAHGRFQRAMNGLAILPPFTGHFPLWRQK